MGRITLRIPLGGVLFMYLTIYKRQKLSDAGVIFEWKPIYRLFIVVFLHADPQNQSDDKTAIPKLFHCRIHFGNPGPMMWHRFAPYGIQDHPLFIYMRRDRCGLL